MSFAKELNEAVKDAPRQLAERRAEVRRDELLIALTNKYLLDVRANILCAAKKGFREKYMNFNRRDFKVNFPGLGTPAQVQRDWLNEMCNPESKYILEDPDTGKKLTLEGICSDVWNNANFTTVFTW